MFDMADIRNLSDPSVFNSFSKFYAVFFSTGRAMRPELAAGVWQSFQTK